MPPSNDPHLNETVETSTKNDKKSIHHFYSKFPKDNQSHVKDLNTTPAHKPQVLVWVPSLTYFTYMYKAFKNVIITWFFNLSMPLFHPLNFILLITVFPALVIGIILLEIVLHVGLMFGLGTLLQDINDKWGEGLSLVNWWDPRIFTSEVDKIVNDGIEALNTPLPPPVPEEQLDDLIFGFERGVQHRGFHLDIAELLLFMSCITYERNDEMVRNAHNLMNQITNEKNAASIGLEEIKSVTDQLRKSEKRIHEQADKWGLKFTSLSELNSIGGPFAGMFWNEEHNFIVVVFKGTTPLNFEDFVIDLMFQRVDARGFVFGEVHEGFYTSLFPETRYSTPRSGCSSPYITIVRAIRSKAADIQALRSGKEKAKINIWVTGHSLGAALAGLFYTRLIKSPRDLGPNCVLRDGYVFGAPSIGDADFAAKFTSYSNYPCDRQSTLWRVIDDVDIITKIPPGWGDPSIMRTVSKCDILNYAHIGEGIQFLQDGSRPKCTIDLFTTDKEPVVIEREKGKSFSLFNWRKSKKQDNDDVNNEEEISNSNRDIFQEYKHKPGSPLPIIEKLLPTFFRNHLPSRYFSAMQRSRKHFNRSINNVKTIINEERSKYDDDSTITNFNEEGSKDIEDFAGGSKSFEEFAEKHLN